MDCIPPFGGTCAPWAANVPFWSFCGVQNFWTDQLLGFPELYSVQEIPSGTGPLWHMKFKTSSCTTSACSYSGKCVEPRGPKPHWSWFFQFLKDMEPDVMQQIHAHTAILYVILEPTIRCCLVVRWGQHVVPTKFSLRCLFPKAVAAKGGWKKSRTGSWNGTTIVDESRPWLWEKRSSSITMGKNLMELQRKH